MRKDEIFFRASINETELTKGAVAVMIVEKNYFTDKCPLRIMTISEFDYILEKIDFQEQLTINVQIFKKNAQDAESEPTLVSSDDYIGIADRNYLDMSSDELELYREEQELGASSREMNKSIRRIMLLDKDHQVYRKSFFNGVYENYSLSSIITYAFSVLRKNTDIKLYMSPLDNTKTNYRETLFVPMGFKQLIDYIDKHFIMYSTIEKTNLFFDKDTLYLLERFDTTEDRPFSIIVLPDNNFSSLDKYGFDDKGNIYIGEEEEFIYRRDYSPYNKPNESILYYDKETEKSKYDYNTEKLSGVNFATSSLPRLIKDNNLIVKEKLVIKFPGADISDLVKPYSKVNVNHRKKIISYRIESYKAIYHGRGVMTVLNLYR